ncbi:hypothetical protein [Nocardia sp. CA-119907]|uniref:hypothetical protein n=1 Tax=Nocardia sp. CA-119907 TaxID=3239973 RepID=UPI003D967697
MSRAVTSGTLLKAVLRARDWHIYRVFEREYVRAASSIGEDLYAPSPRTLRRWQNGESEVPHGYHMSVLEAMLPGYTAEELFTPFDLLAGDPVPAPTPDRLQDGVCILCALTSCADQMCARLHAGSVWTWCPRCKGRGCRHDDDCIAGRREVYDYTAEDSDSEMRVAA